MPRLASLLLLLLASIRTAPARATEVFLMAGQSNSANEGEARMVLTDPRVRSLDIWTGAWAPGQDPQPSATGTRGSPWPVFGSILAHDLDQPIGLVSVGVSGSSVAQWLPSSGLHYSRLQTAIKTLAAQGIRVRALLWHQGEQDVQQDTTAEQYQADVSQIIDHLNQDAGYRIPWFVAEASFVNYADPGAPERARMAEIHRGQELLWQSGLAKRGASTDDLVGPAWRWDGIHLTEAGLKLHGSRWAEVVKAALYPGR